MPGNEFGDRIHNFFGQESLSQDQQHQSQVVDGSWSSFSNGLVSNQKQIDPSLIANLKSYNTQQSVDPGRSQSSNTLHGFSFTQQPMRSEYSRSVLQEHQQPPHAYMHGNLGLQAIPNQANFLGMDVEPSRDRLSTRGFTPDLHKIPTRFEMGESPVNYDFFGGQQQLNTQIPGMLQPFPKQQMSLNDMQLIKQQDMVKQVHDYQMQQQLQKQQLEARHLISLNSNAVNGSRSSDNQSHPLINGVPLQDASSNCWQPDLMTGNTNWMHRGISPVVQGSSSGLMITPAHRQANFLAQQFEPSLYGMPVGGANAAQNAFSSVQMNRLAAEHGSPNRSSSLSIAHQPISFLNQGDVQDSHMLPRSTYQEKLLFSHTSNPGTNNRPNFESFQLDESCERNISGQMEGSGLSENSLMNVSENINALQKPTTLDPTEEKILFGSDDNLWDAFGSSTDMSLTGNLMSNSSDLYDACPSLQSGSWSALMQSAVAETSSDDAVVHELGSKQQSVWAHTNTVPHAKSHIGFRVQDSSVKASNALSEKVHSGSTQTAAQYLQDKGNIVSDHGLLERPMAQHSQMAGNMFHSSNFGIDGQGIDDRLGIWKAASDPNLAALMEQKNLFTQNLQMQRASYGTGNELSAYRDVQENIQQHLDNISTGKAIPQLKSRDGSQILESYASNNVGKVMAESNDMGNSGKENSSDSFRSKFSPESFTCAFKENTDVNASDLSMLPGGKETHSPLRSEGVVGDGLNHKEPANHMLHFGQTVTQSFSSKNHAASAATDHRQISPQITPSRYSQYGAFKNGLNDTGPLKIAERCSKVGNLVDDTDFVQSSKQLSIADPGYAVHMQKISGSTPGAETPLSESLPHGATDKLLKVDKPKKRKTATSGLLSWNKEVMHGPQRLKTLGDAEVDWARATNRSAENVRFENLLEDSPSIRSKRRLIYSTQLMQQLFRPLPDRVMSLVAISNYEFVAYTAARAALGDACSATCMDRSDGVSPPNNLNPLSERTKTEKLSDQYISKAAEDFISRTRKLETDFAGLENGTTIPDLSVEVQDLERFAVINRFASFHQSSSSMDRTGSSLRLNPQRYVTIAPMPRNIPDRVQCLSF